MPVSLVREYQLFKCAEYGDSGMSIRHLPTGLQGFAQPP